LCYSCSQPSSEVNPQKKENNKKVNTSNKNNNKTDLAPNNKKLTDVVEKAKPNTKNKPKPKNNYYDRLKKALNLSPLHIKRLGEINKKYKEKLKAVPKTNKELRKNLSKSKQAEIKQALGANLYQKKLNFDKKK